jgi:hypothetical protein
LLGVSGSSENGLAGKIWLSFVSKSNYLCVCCDSIFNAKIFLFFEVCQKPVFSQSSISMELVKFLEGRLSDLGKSRRLGWTKVLTPALHCNKSVHLFRDYVET